MCWMSDFILRAFLVGGCQFLKPQCLFQMPSIVSSFNVNIPTILYKRHANLYRLDLRMLVLLLSSWQQLPHVFIITESKSIDYGSRKQPKMLPVN